MSEKSVLHELFGPLAPLAGTPEQALNDINQWHPCCRLSPGERPFNALADWWDLGQLNDAILARGGHLKTDPATSASLWFKQFNAQLLPSLTLLMLVRGLVPVLSLERIGIELSEAGDIVKLQLGPGAWLDARVHGWDRVLEQFGDNLVAVYEPLQQWSRDHFRLAKSVFWGNLAFGLTMGPTKVQAQFPALQTDEGRDALLNWVASLPLPLNKKMRMQLEEGTLVQKRATCCLKYNVPGKALCGTCCLDKPPRSTRRLLVPQEPGQS